MVHPQYIRKLKGPIAIKIIAQSYEVEREAFLPMFTELGGIGKMRMFSLNFISSLKG